MTYDHTEPDPQQDPELPDRDEEDDDPRVWCDFDLETMPTARVWKPESLEWAMSVDWEVVNTLVREHYEELTPVLPAEQLVATRHWAGLSPADREGLASLYTEPPYATDRQISSGGHRFAAMRQQGVRWALGQCYVSDIGAGVPELHTYLPLDT
jgi:hypothetical protein